MATTPSSGLKGLLRPVFDLEQAIYDAFVPFFARFKINAVALTPPIGPLTAFDTIFGNSLPFWKEWKLPTFGGNGAAAVATASRVAGRNGTRTAALAGGVRASNAGISQTYAPASQAGSFGGVRGGSGLHP